MDDDYVPSFLAGGGAEIQYAIVDAPKPRLIGEAWFTPIAYRRCTQKNCRKRFKPSDDAIRHCSRECARKTMDARLARIRRARVAIGEAVEASVRAKSFARHLAIVAKRNAPCTPTKERHYRDPPRKCRRYACKIIFSGPKRREYCSRQCSAETRHKPGSWRTCWCGKKFRTPYDYRSSCSVACKYGKPGRINDMAPKALEMRKAGMSYRKIAVALGVASKTPKRMIDRLLRAAP